MKFKKLSINIGKVTDGVDIMLDGVGIMCWYHQVLVSSLVLIRMEGHVGCAIMHQVHQNFFRMVHWQEF